MPLVILLDSDNLKETKKRMVQRDWGVRPRHIPVSKLAHGGLPECSKALLRGQKRPLLTTPCHLVSGKSAAESPNNIISSFPGGLS